MEMPVRFQALEFIHESGVIHLGLKPANIFIIVEGRFKIGDFGMASLWPRPNHTALGSFEGGGAFEREGIRSIYHQRSSKATTARLATLGMSCTFPRSHSALITEYKVLRSPC